MHRSPSHPGHVPVMAARCIELLGPPIEADPAPVVIDATLGLGGHSELLLETFPALTIVGIDRDPRALALATERLAGFSDRFVPVHATYDAVADVAADHAGTGASGILMDLGVSSMQLDEAGRGFAYAQDGPLDMRMDPTRGQSAAELLAELPEAELRRILRVYGEEKFAGRIAKAVVARRGADPVVTSGALVELIREAIPAPARRTGGNPAKRTFQALRIAVNEELEILSRALPAAIDALRIGGRLVVMSYQSLEDRIVKRELARGATSATPPDFPVELPEHAPYLALLTRGAEQAGDAEIAENPRSKPVRLRAAEKTRPRKERS